MKRALPLSTVVKGVQGRRCASFQGWSCRAIRISLLITCAIAPGLMGGQAAVSWSVDQTTAGHTVGEMPLRRDPVTLPASSGESPSSLSEAEVTTLIPPSFTQTGAFVVLCAVAMVVLIGFLFWIRVRQVSTMLKGRHEARLAERDRIARYLHDTLLQSTEGLILKVYTAAQRLPPGDPTREWLTRSVDQAEELAVEGRQKLLGLREQAPSPLELSRALATLGLGLSDDKTCTFTTVKKGRVKDLGTATWHEVFSIAREAINNAFRHAGAGHIEAIVTYGSSALTVEIRDNGRGVPKEMILRPGKTGHIGLRVMHERASQLDAELRIDTGADRGTTVSLVVPGSVAYQRWPAASSKRFTLRQPWSKVVPKIP